MLTTALRRLMCVTTSGLSHHVPPFYLLSHFPSGGRERRVSSEPQQSVWCGSASKSWWYWVMIQDQPYFLQLPGEASICWAICTEMLWTFIMPTQPLMSHMWDLCVGNLSLISRNTGLNKVETKAEYRQFVLCTSIGCNQVSYRVGNLVTSRWSTENKLYILPYSYLYFEKLRRGCPHGGLTFVAQEVEYTS